MLTNNVFESLNYQINREIYSAYFYLGMSAYAQTEGFSGVANWFYIQFKEELEHAKKIFDYVLLRGNKVELKDIETPPQDFKSIMDLYDKTLEHEKKVTKMINDLVEIAKKDKDQQTVDFLQWFVKEQKEEEATPAGIIQQIKQAGSGRDGLMEINKKLSQRSWKD